MFFTLTFQKSKAVCLHLLSTVWNVTVIPPFLGISGIAPWFRFVIRVTTVIFLVAQMLVVCGILPWFTGESVFIYINCSEVHFTFHGVSAFFDWQGCNK